MAEPSSFFICKPDGYGVLLKGVYSVPFLVSLFGHTEQVECVHGRTTFAEVPDMGWYTSSKRHPDSHANLPAHDLEALNFSKAFNSKSDSSSVPSCSAINLFFILIAFRTMIRPEAQSKSVVRNI